MQKNATEPLSLDDVSTLPQDGETLLALGVVNNWVIDRGVEYSINRYDRVQLVAKISDALRRHGDVVAAATRLRDLDGK